MYLLIVNLINTRTDMVRKTNAIISFPFYCVLTSVVWKIVTSVCRI